ncbi:MAG TPA: glycoside hydrolase family 30 protein [Chitinophagaceae bacterium]|nr:glycoside hydrolase family 30 protein [Chitinophagaceae bacterium]HRX92664.1 glycoside hydrolase family 30 protein [Chitinophagaceae bacterium]
MKVKNNKIIKKISPLALAIALFACKENKTSVQTGTAYSTEGKTVIVYTTADSSLYRLTTTDTLSFTPKAQPLESEISVFIDPGKTFQTYLGIGAALTDASAETFYKLPKETQQEFLRAHFDKKEGIGYTVARTNINSCDFSSDMYTYIKEGDSSLQTFDITHDKKFKIPFIQEAQQAAGGSLNLFASPWSPPAFMKTNNDMLHGGKLKPEFYSSWALYYTKFIKAYEKEGVPVWGITVQNEPMATQRWESCLYTAEEERDFLKNYLGPVMHKEGLADKKIIVWDHNRDLIYQRAQTYFNDPEAAKYAWGIGFHWYEDWSGGTPMYENLRRVYESFPDKHIFFTEGCAESFDATRYNAWALGEEYGRSMINDFNNGMVGFTDWNILLDETGGPNHVQNFCFAPVHADTKNGKLIYTNAYYYIGHFSKFIQPGAKRIAATASRSQLLTTAFKNPDGTTVIIVMNQGNIITPYFIWINGKAAEVTALPHSIATILL